MNLQSTLIHFFNGLIRLTEYQPGMKICQGEEDPLVCWGAVIHTDSTGRHIISGRPGRVRSEVGQCMWSAQVARTTPGTVTASGRWGASPTASPQEGTKRTAGHVILVTEALEPLGALAAWTLAQGAVSVSQHLCHLPLRLPFLPGASPGSPEGRVLSLEPHLDK